MRIGILGAFALTLFSCHGERLPTVTLETDKGNIVIELYPEAAPATVANFAKLIEGGILRWLDVSSIRPRLHHPRRRPGGAPAAADLAGQSPANFKTRASVRRCCPTKKVSSQWHEHATPIPRGVNFISASAPIRRGMRISTGTTQRLARVIKGMDVVDALRQGDIMRKVTVKNYTASP